MREVNLELIAKAIEELFYEEIISLHEISKDYWCFRCGDSSVEYHFKAKKAAFESLWIESESIKKFADNKEVLKFGAREFFIEANIYMNMSDETLACFIEEMNQTLYSSHVLQKKNLEVPLEELIDSSFIKINGVLTGHPKLILNKGRLGWGVRELEDFSPESGRSFKLIWVAAKWEKVNCGGLSVHSNIEILRESLSSKEIEVLQNTLKSSLPNSYHVKDYVIFPVHPWQWNRFIAIQYAQEISAKDLIYIGEYGTEYIPQISIRTLSNKRDPKNLDIKLSVSILNTSSVRGIPQRTIAIGHKISKIVNDVLSTDFVFTSRHTMSLNEKAAISMPLEGLSGIENLQYRYKELLGCIWRESVDSKLNKENERAYPTAAFFHKHNGEGFLIKRLIQKSEMSPENWLRSYFDVVIIPLYHLQLRYGIGLVAHGQNTILVTKNYRPHGLVIKDFHGDLRLSENSIFIEDEIAKMMDILPANYLLHDLITGHFVTVLRYMARSISESFDFSDARFFELLGEVVEMYLKEFQEHQDINLEVSLLRNSFEKILVNKVRFVAGYADTRQRLKPMLGNLILNPLVKQENRL